MKFVCNNCGFSAEVPDRRSNCPMCASSNVSVVSPTENPVVHGQAEKVDDQPKKEDVPVQETVKPVVEKKTGTEDKSEPPRKERITLSDDFFDSKPNKEEQEIANILKELYPETGETKKGFRLSSGMKIGGIAAAVLIIISVLFFIFSSDKDKDAKTEEASKESDVQVANNEDEADSEISDEIDEPEDKEPAKAVAAVEKKEEEKIEVKEIKKEIVVAKKVEEPVKQVKPVEPKKPEVVKQVKQVPVTPKKAVVKKEVVKKEVPTVSKGNAFNNFVQAGHKALAEKKYTDALHEYKNASRINPSNGSIYKFLGIAYAYLQNQEQACVNYRKYIQISPNAPDKAQVEAFIKACP